jgi:hypothetical protein
MKMGIIDKSGLDTLDQFLEFLEGGRPGTRVVVARFKDGVFKEEIISKGRRLRDCRYAISSYLDGTEIGVLVDADRAENVRRLTEKDCGKSADYMILSPEEFQAAKKYASKP